MHALMFQLVPTLTLDLILISMDAVRIFVKVCEYSLFTLLFNIKILGIFILRTFQIRVHHLEYATKANQLRCEIVQKPTATVHALTLAVVVTKKWPCALAL